MNKVRFGLNLLTSKITKQKIPFQVNIHLNDVCNLRCKYCYIDFDNASKDMPLPALKKILKDARSLGAERISLEGGEPLLRKDIGEIVDAISSLGMASNINTNGYVLPHRIQQLKNLDLLSVSLDGDQTIHDQLRGKGSFQKAINAIDLAKKHNIKVHVLSVLTKVNRSSIDFMLNLAKEKGVQFVPNTLFFNVHEKYRDYEKEKEYIMTDEENRELFKMLLSKKKKGAPIVWSSQTLKYLMTWPKSYNEKSNMLKGEVPFSNTWKPVKCTAGNHFCVIQTNGNLYTCDPLLGHGPHLNCFELGFKEAYRRLSIGDCVACTSAVCTEYHHLFGLKVPVVWNLMKHYGKST